MRVLFQSRRTLFTVPGGDTIQIMKTKRYLEKYGINVDISTELEPNLSKYDIVHVFNLMRGQETYLQVRNAKRQGKPVALSTIYGLYTEYDRKARGGIAQLIANVLTPFQIEYLKIIARAILNREVHKGFLYILLKGYYNVLKETVSLVDIFLPNSYSEMERVIRDFKLENPLFVVVPNGIDPEIFDYENVEVDPALAKYNDCILCVARIEGRKSQLELVKAVKGLPYKLVLIGKPAPNHTKYLEKIKKEAGENVFYLGDISHDELPKYYKIARVHALVSWMETPGLSSLEAAAMRCNIVVTKKGDTYDYFGDYAYYCEPDDIQSIRDAVLKAYKEPFDEELRNLIMKNYTWEKAAEKTLIAYELLLRQQK